MFPIAILAIIGAVVAAASSRHRQANDGWAVAASRLGIALKPTGGFGGLGGRMSMSGTSGELALTIDTHNSNDRTHTRYRVGYPSLGLGLSAKRTHALARVGAFLGFRDIEVGDPLFDEAIVVNGTYPEQVISFLTPARRIAITGLIEHYPGAVVTDTHITFQRPGLVSDPDELVATIRRLMAVAQEVRGVDRYAAEAAERRLAGDAGEALAILEGAPDTGDPFIDFGRKQQTGEVRRVRGDTRGARAAFDELTKVAAGDPDIARWAEPSGSPPSSPEGTVGDAGTVAEHLFRTENYSFDTMEIFERDYEGATVEWSGDLRRLRRFDHDRDFGDGPGIKAVFGIAELGADLYAGRQVDAIVELPAGSADTLQVGRRYTFRGTLARCDPAMRNLYVSGGSLA